jgi:hypothetical protein
LTDAPTKARTPELKKAAAGAFAAFTIASSVLNAPIAVAADYHALPTFSSSNIVAVTETRQGVYGDYDVEVAPQQYDDARSTFKDAKETKSKKGAYK